MKKSKGKINKIVNSAAVIAREHNKEITKKLPERKEEKKTLYVKEKGRK